MNDIANELEQKNLESITKEKKWVKNCPKCDREIFYTRKDGLIRSQKRNALCFYCKGERISKSQVGRKSAMKGKSFTIEHKRKISESLKGIPKSEIACKRMSLSKMGKKISIESRIKRRINRIKDLELSNGRFHPPYNKEACYYFQWLNMFNNWNGKHALNDGEFYIKDLGYWVDYYEPNLNLVIEWDEKHHYKGGKLRERDIKRQEEIKNYLNCEFYRIKKLTDYINVLKY